MIRLPRFISLHQTVQLNFEREGTAKKYLSKVTILISCALYFWTDIATGHPFPEQPTMRLGKGTISQIAYSPDGKLLGATGSVGVWLYDAETMTEVGLLESAPDHLYSLTFSPDGKTLAAGSAYKAVQLWDIEEQRQIEALTDFSGRATPVVFSPDGRRLAVKEMRGIHLWDIDKKESIAVFKRGRGVHSFAFSPRGEIIASVEGDDGSIIRLWDVGQQRELGILEGHTDWVSFVAFSPDGRTLVSGGVDRTVRIWDVETLELVAELLGNNGTVYLLAFSRDGKWLASSGSDLTTLVWEVNLPVPVAIESEGKRATTLGGLKRTLLLQNFPNPFNPETWMPYHLTDDASVAIQIYDAQGELVRILDLGQNSAGAYLTKTTAAYWDGRNSGGEAVASGVYFYRLRTGEFETTRRMLMVK